MSRVSICDIPVDAITMQETVDLINEAIAHKFKIHHVVINAVKVAKAHRDFVLKNSIVNCDIINADGQGVVWACKLLNRPVPERVSGIDLMERLVKLAVEKKYRMFFLGAKEEIVKSAVDIYSKRYGKEIIAGYRNGYFTEEEEKVIAAQISDSHADILFVAMTSPKKEIFLNTYKDIIQTPFIMGVGGSFDVIAGVVRRAPKWMQECGMEWFYRVMQEPKRMWKRYLYGNTIFIYLVFKEKIKQILKKNSLHP
jgi:N-acetylglucosaminyldiphosphoundecaprenol N-acetyl-beta-D-mannosaminyltransferase